ncbi:TonB-dependent receptor [Parapedomonas caeni]
MNYRGLKATLLSGLAAATLLPPAAARANDAAEAAAQSGPVGIEDIVVTAQKRAENLQDVPVAVSAFSGAALERTYAADLKAISGSVPSLVVTNVVNVSMTAAVSIRGIGVQEADGFIDPAVGVVVDGVYQGSNTTALLDLFDVERIEILRGPQGTLFGANTIGGVINVITKQPTGEFGGEGRVTVGNFGRFDAMAAVNIPLNDNLAGKISVMHKQFDGFYREYESGKRTGGQNVTTGRGYLKYDNKSNFNATLALEYGRGRNDSPPVVNYSDSSMALYNVDVSLPLGSKTHYVTTSQTYNFSDFNIYGATLTMNLDAGAADIVSISNYREFKLDEWTDQDGSPAQLYHTRRITRNWQASQELRATMAPTETTELMVGAYYMAKNYKLDSTSYVDAFVPGLITLLTNDQDDESLAGFTQGYWNATDRLRFQAGVRYTWQKKDMHVTTGINLGGPDIPGLDVRRDKSWTHWGWKLGADYKATDDMLLYASYSRGSHSGGFNGRVSTAPDEIGPYDPEHVDAYEVGLKSDWMDKRVRVNVALFYNKYSDMQVDQLFYEDNQAQTRVLNAASSKIKGAEFEVVVVPVEGLTLNGSLSYLDAQYSNFFLDLDANPANGQEDGSHLNLRNAPKWQGSVGATYTIDVNPGSLALNAQWNRTSRRDTDTRNGTVGIIAPISLINASIKYTSDDDRWSVALWGKNLTDERRVASGFFAPGVMNFASNTAPREVAVEFGFKF